MIATLPGYADVLAIGRDKGGVLLDAGCCCESYRYHLTICDKDEPSQSGLIHAKWP